MAGNDDVTIKIGDEDSTGPDLDKLKLTLAELAKKAIDIPINADDKEAQHQLDLINAKIAETNKKVLRMKTDDASLLRTSAVLSGLDLQIDKMNDKNTNGLASQLDNIVSKLGDASTAGAGFINPMTIGLGALAAIMAGPLIGALLPITAGFATFGAIAVPEIEKVWTAVGKGPKAIAALNPAEQQLAKSIQDLKGEFGGLAKSVQPEILTAFGTAIKIINQLMPALKPLAKAAGDAIDSFLKKMSDWLNSPSGKKFITWLSVTGPKDIKDFGNVMWVVAQAVGRTFDWLVNAGNTWWHNFDATVNKIKQIFSDLNQWLWNDFGAKLRTLLVTDLPAALDLFRNEVRLHWDQIEIATLKLVNSIIGTMAKLPGPLGAPFKKAHADISAELGRIEGDVSKTAGRINSDFQTIHGKSVQVTFQSIFGKNPVNNPIGKKARGGGVGQSGDYLVGEEGPEIVSLPRGANVATAGQTRGILGALAGGTGWNIHDVFQPPARAWAGDLNRMFASSQSSYISQVEKSSALKNWLLSLMPRSGGGLLNPVGSGATVQALMKSMAASVGWTGGLWQDLNNVEMREAGYNIHAQNPGSGAYGLAQFINGPSEYYQYGGNPNTAAGQITGMINYIKQRYGTPAAAWAHELSAGWYDQGGYLPTGLSLAYNGTGKPEPVGHAGGGAMVITLEIVSGGQTDFDKFMMKWMKENVRVKGGGNVQSAFGRS